MTRGSPERLVMEETPPLLASPLGCPKRAWLATLKTSQRASRFQSSWRGMCLMSAASKTLVLGPRRVLRPVLPMWNLPGSAKGSVTDVPDAEHAPFLLIKNQQD